MMDELPTEILSQILCLAVIHWKPSTQPRRYFHPWLVLRYVCRLWKEIIDGQSQLWTTMIVPHSEPYVHLVTRASNDHPIALKGLIRSPDILSPLIRGGSSRIVHVDLQVFDTLALANVISSVYPFLESIRLSSPGSNISTTMSCHTSLFSARRLSLRSIEIPMESLAKFRALRSLSLVYPDRNFNMSSTSFLEILRHIPHLHYLTVSLNFNAWPSLSSHQRVDLPHLSTVECRVALHDAAAILSFLQIRALRRLNLVIVELEPADAILSNLLDKLRILLSTMALSPITTIAVEPMSPLHFDRTTVTICHMEGERGFSFQSRAYGRTPGRHLRHIVRGLRWDSLQALHLFGDSAPRAPAPEPIPCWLDLLTLMPNLTEIHITGDGSTVDCLPLALSGPFGGTVYCPRLSSLRFSEGGFRTRQCKLWRDCLRSRGELGHTVDEVLFWRWSFPRIREWKQGFQAVCPGALFSAEREVIFTDDVIYDSIVGI